MATTLFVNTTSAGWMLAGLRSGSAAQLFGDRSVFLRCALLTAVAWGLTLLVSGRTRSLEAGA
ncbi:hypothetical protein [Deinococcus sp.]|uniref:hypothetical protein n=1 Tax=Deinococcus sp. TaxID=47478 RepID=UPI003C7D82C6